jgi:hypothetical protein
MFRANVLRRFEVVLNIFRFPRVKPNMKKIMVTLAALAVLALVVPPAEAGGRYRGKHHRSGHAISSHHGHHSTVVRHGYRRAYYNPYYGGYYRNYYRGYYSPYYAAPYYSPYYGVYSPYYGGYSPYFYGAPGIVFSFGGGHHGGHHGHHGHHGGHH